MASLLLSGCATSDVTGPGAAASAPTAPGADVASSPDATAPADAEPGATDGADGGADGRDARATASTRWGPSRADWQQAGRLVRRMNLDQLAGHVIVAGYAGLEPPVDQVVDLNLGGVLLLADNVPAGPDSAERLGEITSRLQRASDRPYPLVVAVDQEGGPVARIGAPLTEFPPGMAHGAADERAVSRTAARAMGQELAAVGVTMNLAPVADVTSGPDDPTIGVRSPGSSPAVVSRATTAQMRGLLEGGVVAVVKHFPGHGSVPADSHVELPVQSASVEALRARDLQPFARAVAAGAPAVMVAHLDVRDVDPGVPSSMSAAVVTGLLRDELGFDGVVVTDALAMAAITERYSSAQSAVLALRAGADLLVQPPDPRAARDGIVAAVQDGRLPRQRLVEAVQRVVALQLYHDRALRRAAPDAVGTAQPASRALSQAAVSLVAGACTGPYVGGSVQVVGAEEADVTRFEQAARAAGLRTGAGPLIALDPSVDQADADVVVGLGTPYGVAQRRGSVATFALFGRTPEAFSALVDVLLGRQQATGELPVDVGGAATPSC